MAIQETEGSSPQKRGRHRSGRAKYRKLVTPQGPVPIDQDPIVPDLSEYAERRQKLAEAARIDSPKPMETTDTDMDHLSEQAAAVARKVLENLDPSLPDGEVGSAEKDDSDRLTPQH